MIIIILPAKNFKKVILLYEAKHPPLLLDKTKKIVQTMQDLSIEELSKCFKAHEYIAKLNKLKYEQMNFNLGSYAISLFDGLVFKNIKYSTLNDIQKEYTHQHVRFLSALYEMLKPIDDICLVV